MPGESGGRRPSTTATEGWTWRSTSPASASRTGWPESSPAPAGTRSEKWRSPSPMSPASVGRRQWGLEAKEEGFGLGGCSRSKSLGVF